MTSHTHSRVAAIADASPRSTPAIPADAEILAVLVGTLSRDELERVAVCVRDVLASRQLGWVRHEGDAEFHSIEEIAGGSVVVECGGRMSVSAPFELEARPAIGDRRKRCQARRAQKRLVAEGLIELRDAQEGAE